MQKPFIGNYLDLTLKRDSLTFWFLSPQWVNMTVTTKKKVLDGHQININLDELSE